MEHNCFKFKENASELSNVLFFISVLLNNSIKFFSPKNYVYLIKGQKLLDWLMEYICSIWIKQTSLYHREFYNNKFNAQRKWWILSLKIIKTLKSNRLWVGHRYNSLLHSPNPYSTATKIRGLIWYHCLKD